MDRVDSYHTVERAAEIIYKIKSSKFITYIYPIESPDQVVEYLEPLRKRHYDATHHCYAWRIGAAGEQTRACDDGEPSSTAGKPILGQMLSHGITNCLIVVVRYFGGTKLGVSGLIEAYRESANLVIEASEIVERTVDCTILVEFSFVAMNGVMKVVKDIQPKIISQEFDNLCHMRLSIRESHAPMLIARLEKVEGATIEIDADE